MSEWFKEFVARPRPSALWFVEDGNSFPSGHVTNAATIFGAAYYCIGKHETARPWHRALLLIFSSAAVLLISFQRIYFTHHWLSDAVGGALLGIGWCFFVIDRFGRGVTMRSIPTVAIVFAGGFVVLHVFPNLRVSSPVPTALRETPAESLDLAAYTPNMIRRRDRRPRDRTGSRYRLAFFSANNHYRSLAEQHRSILSYLQCSTAGTE